MFTCHLPKSVYIGENSLSKLPDVLKGVTKAVIFSGRHIEKSGILKKPVSLMENAGISVSTILDMPSEPTCGQAQKIADTFFETGAQAIIAIGGGSIMDVAKVCSILPSADVKVMDLINDISLAKRNVISVMVPTTSGTGSEATFTSIIAVPEKMTKAAIITPEMLPDAVFLDGNMVKSLSPEIAAATGVDTFCHAIECFTSKKATPVSNMFALESLKIIFSHLEKACLDPLAYESKNAMQLAAFYGGAAIAASGTTAVHALSYPLGVKYHIAHGVSNAMLLLPVMRFNFDSCRKEFEKVYDALGEKGAQDKAQWILNRMEEIIRNINIPTSLKAYGVTENDLDDLTAAGMKITRLLLNNKKTVTAEDARKIYQELLK